MIKKITLSALIMTTSLFSFSLAQWNQNPGYEIIPWSSSNVGATVDGIRKGGDVRNRYKDAAYGKTLSGTRIRAWGSMSVGEQFASGIMTWDTILDYAVYLIKFLWQLALLAGAIMIIYYWYKKSTEHLKFNGTLWKVVIGILVISFAYVIVKAIWSMFIS